MKNYKNGGKIPIEINKNKCNQFSSNINYYENKTRNDFNKDCILLNNFKNKINIINKNNEVIYLGDQNINKNNVYRLENNMLIKFNGNIQIIIKTIDDNYLNSFYINYLKDSFKIRDYIIPISYLKSCNDLKMLELVILLIKNQSEYYKSILSRFIKIDTSTGKFSMISDTPNIINTCISTNKLLELLYITSEIIKNNINININSNIIDQLFTQDLIDYYDIKYYHYHSSIDKSYLKDSKFLTLLDKNNNIDNDTIIQIYSLEREYDKQNKLNDIDSYKKRMIYIKNILKNDILFIIRLSNSFEKYLI